MRIARAHYDEIVAHARADAPEECCGLVSVSGEQVVEVYRTANAEASRFRFEIDGRELLRVTQEIEDAGHELGAIYHSHTRSDPYPSQTDINFAANWPGLVWIIVGLKDSSPEVKAYEIRGGQVADAELTID